MFLGQAVSIRDDRDYLIIPPAFNELQLGQMVIMQGFERNILLIPMDVFLVLSDKVSSLNITDPNVRRLQRMLFASAIYVQANQYRAIHIPAELMDFAGLSKNVVWVGQGKYVELWSQEAWHQVIVDLQDVGLNSEKFVSLNLSGL